MIAVALLDKKKSSSSFVLVIPQQAIPLNLRTFIDHNNPQGLTDVTLVNSLTQPTFLSGDMTGLNVKLINNGEIVGSVPGANGISITSAMELVNNGWIRGAGGNGGKGGVGKKGAHGAQGASGPRDSSVASIPFSLGYKDIPQNIYGQTRIAPNCAGGTFAAIGANAGTAGHYTAFPVTMKGMPGVQSISSSSLAGVGSTSTSKGPGPAGGGGLMTVKIEAVSQVIGTTSAGAAHVRTKWTVIMMTGTVLFYGGYGGAGGAGSGSNANGGAGQSFASLAAPGVGVAGSRGHPGDPGKFGCLGASRGDDGDRGDDQALGGTGGVWATAGDHGLAGTGGAGSAGGAAGKAIIGSSNLIATSITGNVSGVIA